MNMELRSMALKQISVWFPCSLLFSTFIHGAAGAAHTDPLDSLSEPDREILDTLEKSPANSHVQLHVIYVGFFELDVSENSVTPKPNG